jgi:hypothetical protein
MRVARTRGNDLGGPEQVLVDFDRDVSLRAHGLARF